MESVGWKSGAGAGDVCPAGEAVQVSIEKWARESPEALAVCGGGQAVTFGQLNRRANRLAHLLQGMGVGPEGVVATLFPRSPESIVAALGVLKAGGAYLPLDAAYPDDRLLYSLEDAKAVALLLPRQLADARPILLAGPGRSLVLEDQARALAEQPESDPAPASGLDHLAYVIYTSGSSGRPKGVEIEHRGLAHLVAWHQAAYRLRPEDRTSRLAGSAFDAAVWEIWPTLAAGASLHIPDDELVPSPDRLAAWLAAERITLSFLPTPLAEAFLREPFPAEGVLRTVLTGGDRLHLRPRPGVSYTLVNHYGPTENSVVSTAGVVAASGVDDPALGLPSIGTEIAEVVGYVVDAVAERLADGEEGELLLGGPGLARGYRGRPDLTAERFVPDPWSGGIGARLYRSGDRVRRRPSGELDFIGRLDFQVKIRGFRIELGEIEASLRQVPEVREAAVVASAPEGDPEGEKRLVGYVVPEPAADRDDLAERLTAALAARLPEYMVPSLWLLLDELPLTPNGKVDLRALPAPEVKTAAALPPATPTEELVAALFAEVLGLWAIGVEDDFFALGGHSLRATQVASRLRAARGFELPARALFDRPTVRALAAWLDELQSSTEAHAGDAEGWTIAPAVRPAGDRWELPASFAQQRVWLADRWGGNAAVYNTPFAFDLRGDLDPAALGAALRRIVARHEALRTTFRGRSDEPSGSIGGEEAEVLQVVSATLEMALPLVDLSALPPRARLRAAEELERAEARRPFDLERGPVFRTLVIRRSEREHTLLVLLHHIVSDDWSMSLLAQELAAGYGGGAPLQPLPVQYADFSLWQRQWLRGETLERQLAWWRDQLRPPLPLLDLPTDRPRPARQRHQGQRLRRSLSAAAQGALRDLATRRDASPFMVLAAAFGALLGRHSGAEELAFGTPIANRHRLEVERLIGFFVNTLVLRSDLAGEPTLADLVDRQRESLLGAYEHQDLPFEELITALAPERDFSRNPLVDAFLIYANAPRPPAELAPGLLLELRELEADGAKVDLSLFIEDHSGEIGDRSEGLLGIWEYDTDLFDRATIERMAGHLDALLERGGARDAGPLSGLSILSAAEQGELSRLASGGLEPAHPPLLLHDLFFAQAARTPEGLALVVGEERWTYGDLERRVRSRVRWLRALGVGPEVGVAIFLERSAELVVSLLGVMASGGFYVPLDPRYPAERLAFLLEDSRCRVVLTSGALADSLPATEARVVRLGADEIVSSPQGSDQGAIAKSSADPENLAYLIYTSGSTGRPKAVAIAHRSAVTFAYWAREVFTPLELSGVLAATSITFDLSVFELFVPLAWGGTVYLAEDALSLPRLPAKDEVRLVNTVPSALAELLRMGALPPGVRTVNLAGEPLPRTLAAAILAQPGVATLYDLYGPSEDTTYSTFAAAEDGRTPLIGRPIAGSSAWVVDRYGNQQPRGVPGELWLGGAGLARGYLDRPDLTSARFVPDPFSGAAGAAGARLYRTGDLVRLLPDGQLDYLGRIDHQVKVRGFRIELGEIEQAISGLAGIEGALVMALEHPVRGLELAAFVTALDDGAGSTPSAWREALRRRLPDYMVPSRFHRLAEFPLTPNGKVDRRALAAIGAADGSIGAEGSGEGASRPFEPPSGAIEEAVADIFSAVLGIERVGAEESFFEIGGNSLVATRVLARVRKTFGLELELRLLFEVPTVRGLAARIVESLGGSSEAPMLPLVAAPRPLTSAPLSFAQERLWFLDHLEPGSTLYAIPLVLTLAGPLVVAALERALRALAARHEILRTTYATSGSEPVQRIAKPVAVPLPIVDLVSLGGEKAVSEAERLALREALHPFDLAQEPPVRWTLVRLQAGEHRLLLTLHHIAADGRSLEILLRDLRSLYRSALGEVVEPLPALPVQYADFALWQRRRWTAAALAGALEGQVARLEGMPQRLELPVDRPHAAGGRHQGDIVSRRLSPSVSRSVESLARDAKATPFIVLLSLFQLLLGRLCDADDLAVGTPVGGRLQAETEELIGLFLNTLVLRGRIAPDSTFEAHLAATRRDTLAAFDGQQVPFEKLVEALSPERQLARSPLFQVLFVFQGRSGVSLDLAPGLGLTLRETLSRQAKFDLKLVIETTGERFRTTWELSTALFDPATIERFADAFTALAERAGARPAAALRDLDLLSDGQRRELLAPGVPSRWAEPEPVLRRFERWAQRTPEAPAVEDERSVLTYRELNRRAERIALRLRRSGILERVVEPIVAVCLPRSVEWIVAVLGAWKCGAAYLALDPDDPDDRLAFKLRDSGAVALLGDASSGLRLDELALPFFDLESGGEDGEPAPSVTPSPPSELAYVIYTSGSTGSPKGVLVGHRQLACYVDGVVERMEIPCAARYATVSTFAADLGHTAIFPALTTGGTLVVVGKDRTMDPDRLAELFAERPVDVLKIVPSHLAALLGADRPERLVPRQLLVLGGEAAPGALLASVRGLAPECRVLNHYGPTETTVGVLAYPTWSGAGDEVAATLPLGWPLGTSRGVVIDSWGAPALPGIAGELWIGGGQVARGYLGRPDLTAERFVPDPFAGLGERLYRTGDRARRRSDGGFQFLGRIDHQVKIRGFRVELREIEAALAELPGIAEALVVSSQHPTLGTELAAFVVRREAAELPSLSELREGLRRRLPEAMIPASFQLLPALPLTANGKVDREALGRLARASGSAWPVAEGESSSEEAPQGALEEQLTAIFAAVLGIESVGANQTFFDLGGHSLAATQLLARIQRRFDVAVEFPSFFARPTVRGLAALILAELGEVPGAPAPALPERPLSPLEQTIADTFLTVLGCERVESQTDFFHAGGHSLAAIRAVIRLRRVLGRDLELRALFDHPTVEALARYLEANVGGAEGIASSSVVRPAVMPVSLVQQRIWLLELLLPGSPMFNMPARYRIDGELSIPGLRAALERLVERHEALRTVFAPEDDGPEMILDRPPVISFLQIDLRALPPEVAERTFDDVAEQMATTPFGLAEGALFRAALACGARSEILFTLHHLISDGWSNGIVLHDLAELYAALAEERPSSLAPLDRQYSDYVLWQRAWLQGENLERQLEFWRRELREGIEALELPTDRPRRAVPHAAGRFETIALDAALLRSAEAVGREHGGTLFVTLLAAFELLLARQAGHHRFALGVPVANRDRFDAEGIVGCFTNTLVLRADTADSASFGDLVLRVRDRMLAALGHQDIPFERLVDELAPDRDLSRTPFFQAVFTLGSDGRGSIRLGPAARMNLVPSHTHTAKLELLLNVVDDGDESAVAIEYRSDLWDAVHIRRLATQLTVLLRVVVAAPDRPLDGIAACSAAERHQLLVEWGGREEPDDDSTAAETILGRIAREAELRPAAVALRRGRATLSYGDLERRSTALALALRRGGLRPGGVVVLALEGIDLTIALTAVWKAGAAASVIEPSAAEDRSSSYCRSVHASLLLHRSSEPSRAAGTRCMDLADLDAIGSGSALAPPGDPGPLPLPPLRSGDRACLLEHRGADGAALRVELRHRELLASLDAFLSAIEARDGDAILALHPASTDLGLFELLAALVLGGRAEMVDAVVRREPERLAAALEESGATQLQASPALWRGLLSCGWKGNRGFKAVVRGPLDGDLAAMLAARGAEPWSAFAVPGWGLPASLSSAEGTGFGPGSFPLGRPLASSRFALLGDGLELAPAGAAAELHFAAGAMVACLSDDPVRTALRFVPDPSSGRGAAPGARLYRTGERGRWTSDGRLEILGQVEGLDRGKTAAMSEVERVLQGIPGVRLAEVAARRALDGRTELVAYVVLEPAAPDLRTLLRLCRAELPAHRVPVRLVPLPSFPWTERGEVDRLALEASGEATNDPPKDSWAAPRSELEVALATLWSEVLGAARVSLNDNFWELGGHSLLATKVLGRIARTFAVDLPFDALFRRPLLADFAALLEEHLIAGDLDETSPELVPMALGS